VKQKKKDKTKKTQWVSLHTYYDTYVKKKDSNKWGNWNLHTWLLGMLNDAVALENSWAVLQKVK
jgi:hypothetical protein